MVNLMNKIDNYIRKNKYKLLIIELIVISIALLLVYVFVDDKEMAKDAIGNYINVYAFVILMVITLSLFNRVTWNFFKISIEKEKFNRIIDISVMVLELFVHALGLFMIIFSIVNIILGRHPLEAFSSIIGAFALYTSFYFAKYRIWKV